MSALINPRRLAPMLAVVACFALTGPIVAAALASDNSIISVVNRWSPIVKHDEDALVASQKTYKKHRKAGPVVAAYQHEVSDLDSFASQLKHQSASTRTGAQGRDEISAGLLQIATAYQRFASELREAGTAGLTTKQISSDTKIQLAGHHKIVAGFNLLKKL